jgi:fluoroacetyl-CoA thioesterase
MTLTIKGEVLEVDGRRVKFRVEAWDGMDRITEGMHERMIILPEKFNARLQEKKAKQAV